MLILQLKKIGRLINLVLLLIMIFHSPLANAKSGSQKDSRTFGISFGHQTPVPSNGGINLHFYPTSFMSLEIGGGLFVDSSKGLGGVLGDTMLTSMFYLMTLGLIRFTEIYQFLSGEDLATLKYTVNWGGGTRFYVPHWQLSPTLGVHWVSVESHNGALGLPERSSHFYFTSGLEWQTPLSFFLSGGLAFSPSLPENYRYLGYFQLGSSF